MLNERSMATMCTVEEPDAPALYGRAKAAASSSSAAIRAASSSR